MDQIQPTQQLWPYNQMGLINVGACLLHAPATKQIQVDSIFAVRSKLRQLRAPATNKLTRNVNDLRVFCWLEKILNIANLFVGANRGQT